MRSVCGALHRGREPPLSHLMAKCGDYNQDNSCLLDRRFHPTKAGSLWESCVPNHRLSNRPFPSFQCGSFCFATYVTVEGHKTFTVS
mmetsp:Transcript_38699/g.81223  ORF Transcript_38699/g.81223 Transcript_38699/m.81223 type:complete len:87 (-) Transcript_38699:112-372(-)